VERSCRVPARVPVGTKYVLESHGSLVRRYVEFPDGRRIELATRKALTCTCAAWREISIAPDQSSTVYTENLNPDVAVMESTKSRA
jgi:hypothetical protein